MKLTYYGTAAGGGIPELFCSCRICEQARAERGNNIRSRSQAVIDGCLSIDFPVDVRLHMVYGGLDMRKINDIIVTHSHYDHFLHQDLISRPQGYNSPLRVWFTQGSSVQLCATIEKQEAAYASGKKIRTSDFIIEPHIIKDYEPFDTAGFHITPLTAHHDRKIDSVLFIIEKDGKRIFWAHDTGPLYDSVKDYLKTERPYFDLISLDCTLERGNPITAAHLDLDGCLELIGDLRDYGCIDEHTQIYLSHIGHLVNRTHDELVAEAAEYGISVAYDGLTVEI